MKKNSIRIIDEGFFLLNENQNFRFDREASKKILENIQFPIIVLDTEFFNHSHDIGINNNKLYNDPNKDLVYVIQYSFAKSLKEISNRDNKKAIKSITIKRNFNDKTYDFFDQYSKMIVSFLNMCRNKEIRTIVCAGASNDIKIINQWINENKKLFARKTLKMAFYNKESKELNANYFDIYDILEKTFSFSNTTKTGEEFWKRENLPKGKQNEEMIALTGTKKFFDWFEEINQNLLKDEKEDIYSMCCNAYSFLSKSKDVKIDFEEYKQMNRNIKKVIEHCYNDVLKVLEFLSFVYEFTHVSYLKNVYIKKY